MDFTCPVISNNWLLEGKKEGCIWTGPVFVRGIGRGGCIPARTGWEETPGGRPQTRAGGCWGGVGGRGDDSEINNKIKTFVEQSEAMQQKKRHANGQVCEQHGSPKRGDHLKAKGFGKQTWVISAVCFLCVHSGHYVWQYDRQHDAFFSYWQYAGKHCL